MANRMLRDAITLLYEAVQAEDNLDFNQSSHFSREAANILEPLLGQLGGRPEQKPKQFLPLDDFPPAFLRSTLQSRLQPLTAPRDPRDARDRRDRSPTRADRPMQCRLFFLDPSMQGAAETVARMIGEAVDVASQVQLVSLQDLPANLAASEHRLTPSGIPYAAVMRSPADLTFHCFGASRTPPGGIQRLTVMDVLELVRAEEVLRRRPAAERQAEPQLEPSDVWQQYESDDGFPYWHNAATNESRWEPPPSGPAALPPSVPSRSLLGQPAHNSHNSSPSNRPADVWQYFETDNGEPYWHNPATGESRWEDPNPPPQAPMSPVPLQSLAQVPTPAPLGVFVAKKSSPPPSTKAWIRIGMQDGQWYPATATIPVGDNWIVRWEDQTTETVNAMNIEQPGFQPHMLAPWTCPNPTCRQPIPQHMTVCPHCRAARPSAAMANSAVPWLCRNCQTHNPAALVLCSRCAGPKPSQSIGAPIYPPQQATVVENPWKCHICQAVNPPHAPNCNNCRTKRASAPMGFAPPPQPIRLVPGPGLGPGPGFGSPAGPPGMGFGSPGPAANVPQQAPPPRLPPSLMTPPKLVSPPEPPFNRPLPPGPSPGQFAAGPPPGRPPPPHPPPRIAGMQQLANVLSPQVSQRLGLTPRDGKAAAADGIDRFSTLPRPHFVVFYKNAAKTALHKESWESVPTPAQTTLLPFLLSLVNEFQLQTCIFSIHRGQWQLTKEIHFHLTTDHEHYYERMVFQLDGARRADMHSPHWEILDATFSDRTKNKYWNRDLKTAEARAEQAPAPEVLGAPSSLPVPVLHPRLPAEWRERLVAHPYEPRLGFPGPLEMFQSHLMNMTRLEDWLRTSLSEPTIGLHFVIRVGPNWSPIDRFFPPDMFAYVQLEPHHYCRLLANPKAWIKEAKQRNAGELWT